MAFISEAISFKFDLLLHLFALIISARYISIDFLATKELWSSLSPLIRRLSDTSY